MKPFGRKPISKSLRFRVFERDQYTCQYCGRRPPEVVLQIDHRLPVSLGGDNDEMNLMSACVDCNQGKSDRAPGQANPSPDAAARAAAVHQEAAEYAQFLEAQRLREQTLALIISGFQKLWQHLSQGRFHPSDLTMKRWCLRFGPELVEVAIGKSGWAFATGKISARSGEECETAIRYVAGILWNLERGNDGTDS